MTIPEEARGDSVLFLLSGCRVAERVLLASVNLTVQQILPVSQNTTVAPSTFLSTISTPGWPGRKPEGPASLQVSLQYLSSSEVFPTAWSPTTIHFDKVISEHKREERRQANVPMILNFCAFALQGKI